MSYDTAFFAAIREGCKQSAEAVVPLIVEDYEPRSVVDVGCGEGWWGKVFEERHCEVLGLDGDYADPVIPWAKADLTGYVPNVGTFDLAVCLEVAEHLPKVCAPDFVAALCRLAPVVVFSAAVPGQGGTGHLNEQWPDYWAALFAQHGFRPDTHLRSLIWRDERVKWWYRQNIIVFDSTEEGESREAPCLSVVHPEMLRHHGWA